MELDEIMCVKLLKIVKLCRIQRISSFNEKEEEEGVGVPGLAGSPDLGFSFP